jgi:hypothetical protein
MNNLKTIRLLNFFILFISSFNPLSSSLHKGTLVATSHGLVCIERLKVGDKILSYDFNAKDPANAIIEVSVTKTEQLLTNTVFTIYTGDDGKFNEEQFVQASPQQLFLTFKTLPNQPADISAVNFIQTQYIMPKDLLVDAQMQSVPITYMHALELKGAQNQYVERIERDKHGIKLIERRYITVDMYAIEVEAPHTFLIANCSYYIKNNQYHLLITHNGLPMLALGVDIAFGSTPSSLSFAGATAAIGPMSTVLGPAGLAIGCVAGLTVLGYQLFKKNKDNKTSFYIERAGGPGSCPGGLDPKDPKNKKDDQDNNKERKKNTINKKDFFNSVKDQYEHWKEGIYKKKPGAEGLGNGKAEFLDWDHLHNDVEAYNKLGKHIGSLDPETLQLYKNPVLDRLLPK